MLYGECKWWGNLVGENVLDELIERWGLYGLRTRQRQTLFRPICQIGISLVLNTSPSLVRHGGCSTGSGGPRPRPPGPASCRGTGSRAATCRRRRASTRPDRSP